MDDIQLFSNNEKKLETLIQTKKMYSQDIGMEFGIEKYAMLIMRSGKRQIMEGIEQSNQERIRTFGKRNLQVLGNIGSRHHQTSRGERKNEKRVSERNKKTF